MTVYVDDMRAPFGKMIMCHMIADTEKELHDMAFAIGLQRRWYQGDHYDVALVKRAEAVSRGAVEITWRQAGAMMACVRLYKLPMPKPEDAETVRAEMRERVRAKDSILSQFFRERSGGS